MRAQSLQRLKSGLAGGKAAAGSAHGPLHSAGAAETERMAAGGSGRPRSTLSSALLQNGRTKPAAAGVTKKVAGARAQGYHAWCPDLHTCSLHPRLAVSQDAQAAGAQF
jgi:hypothetical protein